MEFFDEIENEIEQLKDNEYGIIVNRTKSKGMITINITVPQEIVGKEITDEPIEFKLIIDTYSLKISPKLYCITPYCVPHLADGRDLYKELRNSKSQDKGLSLVNLLGDIVEFIKINFERGGLFFCGNFYLGAKYDLRILQKGCTNIINVKENLKVNGKNVKYNRVLVLSDVYFLLFQQEKWYKNNLTLLFWASINNIEKIQKVKDNKTIILHWTQKDKENPYLMNLTITHRDLFIKDLLEKMKTFGMNYDVMRVNGQNISEDNSIPQNMKLNKKINNEKSNSQNVKLVKNQEENEKEEVEEDGEEEEEEKKNGVNNKENEKGNKDNLEGNKDKILDEEKIDDDEINIDINISKKEKENEN